MMRNLVVLKIYHCQIVPNVSGTSHTNIKAGKPQDHASSRSLPALTCKTFHWLNPDESNLGTNYDLIHVLCAHRGVQVWLGVQQPRHCVFNDGGKPQLAIKGIELCGTARVGRNMYAAGIVSIDQKMSTRPNIVRGLSGLEHVERIWQKEELNL